MTTTVTDTGSWIENPELETETPGPSGITNTTNWSHHGHPYPQYGALNNRSRSYQNGFGLPSNTHGVRPVNFQITGLNRTKSPTSTGPNDESLDEPSRTASELALHYNLRDETGAEADVDGDDDECVDIDECADTRLKRKRKTKSKPIDNQSTISDEAPPAKLTTRGTYHIQKKRSSSRKLKAISKNIDIVDSENESIPPPTVERPVIIRPKPGLTARDPIVVVYGFWFEKKRPFSCTKRVFSEIILNLLK